MRCPWRWTTCRKEPRGRFGGFYSSYGVVTSFFWRVEDGKPTRRTMRTPTSVSRRLKLKDFLLESAVSAGLLLLPGARPGPRGGGVAAGQVQWNRPGPEDAQDPFVWRPWAKKRRPLRWARRSTARGLTSREMSCWACGGSSQTGCKVHSRAAASQAAGAHRC